jgi:hypothetical protein
MRLLEKFLAFWDTYQMKKSTLLVIPVLLAATSCSSTGSSEAAKTAFFSGCILVTSAYDTWAATGENSSTETGQLGRENLETSLSTALSSLSEFVSESELEDAKNVTSEGSSQEVSGPQIYLQIKEIQFDINNWESVVQYPNWTPGKMATFDGSMNSLKASCDTYKNQK